MPDLNMSQVKMSDLVSVPLLGFTLVIKLRNFDFEKHAHTLIFFDKKMVSDLNISYGKMSEFVSFPLFWLTFKVDLVDF